MSAKKFVCTVSVYIIHQTTEQVVVEDQANGYYCESTQYMAPNLMFTPTKYIYIHTYVIHWSSRFF